MLRWIVRLTIGLIAALAACLAVAWFLLGQFDLAGLAANRATVALGRAVLVSGLHVKPGRWIHIDLTGLEVANPPGASRTTMLQLGRLTGDVQALPLLRGAVIVRGLRIDGLSIVLERLNPSHAANWIFGRPGPSLPPPATPPRPDGTGHQPPAPARGWFPTLLDADLANGEVTYRTAGGAAFRTRLDSLRIIAPAADQPVQLDVAGAYNNVPVGLTGMLQPYDRLHDSAAPYGMQLHIVSADTILDFNGTMTDPLGFDGIQGTLALKAPSSGPILAIAGVGSQLGLSLDLTGSFDHAGDLWRLSGGTGALQGNPITDASLRLNEGSKTQPDDVAMNLAFDRLDLNGLLGRGGGNRASASNDADLSLDIDRTPDTLLSLGLAARQVSYGRFRFSDAQLSAAQTPGRITVTSLGFGYLGGRLQAAGQIEAADKGSGRVKADVNLAGADVQQLRQALGLAAVPLSGPLNAQVLVTSDGTTLNAAARQARVSAAISMTSGGIARQVVRMASADIRLLFSRPSGTSTITCMLGVLDMRAGIGTVLPLRLRTQDGTIVGNAQFDLYRSTFDLTFASQTASAFALDIPVRVFGSFAKPTIRPARWSRTGRAMLAATDSVARLPPGVQQFAQRSPCLSPR